MNTIKGENLMIFVKEDDLLGDGSTALIPLAMATSCELNVTVDDFDTTSKDSGSWKASKPGMKGWTMSSSNLYTPHADALLSLQISRTPIKVYWLAAINSEVGNVTTHAPALEVDGEQYLQYSGYAWINNFQATANNNEAANYTVNLTGTGAFTPDTKFPAQGVGVSKPNLSILAGSSDQVIASGYTGTLTATCSYSGVTCTVGIGGVITVSVAAGASAGATHILVSDSGTSTSCYVSLIIRTT